MLLPPLPQVWFQEVGYAPNAPSVGYQVGIYTDGIGKQYMLDLVSHQIVEITPGQGEGGALSNSPVRSEPELQAIAEHFILRNTPQFATLKSQLTYAGGNKGGENYFFRWEDRSAGSWENMPPMVQVGITVNGNIFSYINTLFLAPSQ
jgi:hypothetical protein